MSNPYKELSPYRESDAHSFKGRSVEISEMYESFDRHEYLVCHADSGEGKSSIIEAGLIPKMKTNCYFPVRILFKSDEHFKNKDEHFKNKDVDFDEVICGIINNEIEKFRSNKSLSVDVVYPKRLTNNDEGDFADWERNIIDSYAWLKLRYARITIDNLIYTPVLIFDQFEEVFTNPQSQEWTDKFFAWLQELSMDLCPQRIINELEKHISDDAFPEIDTQKHFKAIFSLRSEYVGRLDYWGLQRHYIPLLKNNRYLLRPLTIKGAKEVITQQEGYNGLNDVADDIIDILRERQKGKNYVMDVTSELPCIPALFLSIICSRTFTMSQEERAAFMQKLLAEKDEDKDTAINSLIEGFYEEAVAKCGIPIKDMGIIEDVLVNNEGNRQRVSSHADTLKTIDFSTKYMKGLKAVGLIRVIPEYNREDDIIEFVHDALCPIITKRKERKRLEEAEIAKKEAEKKEAKKREEERLREQVKKNRKRLLFLSCVIIFAFTIIGFFFFQNQEIERTHWKMLENQARFVSEKALELIDEGDSYLARLLLLEVLPNDLDHPNYPYVVEAENAYRIINLHQSAILRGHTDEVYSASFSPDGKRIVSASVDKTVRIWDAENGRQIGQPLNGHTEMVLSASFSPDGKRIVSASWDNTIRIWDAETGRQIGQPLEGHTGYVSSASFSPDGKRIVSASADRIVRIWDAETGRRIGPLVGHTSCVRSASFSPDGKRIVSASDDYTVRIWDAETGRQIGQPLEGHTNIVYSASFSPDGKRIVSASGDKTVRIWDAQTGRQIGQPLEGHTNYVCSASFSHDGKYIVSASGDNTVRIWDAETGRQIGQPLEGHTDAVCSASFSPDGKRIVSASVDNTVRIWDAQTVRQVGQLLEGHTDCVNYASFSPDGKRIVSASNDRTVRIWDAQTGHQIGQPLGGYRVDERSASFSPDGKRIASASSDNTIRIWDAQTGRHIGQPLEGHTSWVRSAFFSPDGKRIVSASDDYTVRIWDAETGRQISQPLKGHTNTVFSASFSPDGKRIVSASADNTIRIWDAETGRQIGQPLEGHTNSVYSASFSPDGKRIVSASGDKTVRIWDAETCRQIGQPLEGHTNYVWSASFSHDGKYIVSASADKTVRIWDAETGRQIGQPLEGHTDDVLSASFSPDGKRIVSASIDHTVRIWDFPPFQQLIDETREQFKNRPLTPEERRKYYLD